MRFFIFLLSLFLGSQVCARELTDLHSFGEPSTSTMYLFTSPNCPHCKAFHKTVFPTLIKRYVDTKQAQVVIVDMPYDDATMHAVMMMRCLPEAKATKLMGWLYENQSKWMTSHNPDFIFMQYGQVLGMYQSEFQACINNQELKSAIEQQRDSLSALYGIRGWPTLALRQGNVVKFYAGTDKHMIISELDREIKKFQEEQKKRAKMNKK